VRNHTTIEKKEYMSSPLTILTILNTRQAGSIISFGIPSSHPGIAENNYTGIAKFGRPLLSHTHVVTFGRAYVHRDQGSIKHLLFPGLIVKSSFSGSFKEKLGLG
jgi:hypothetical protein